MADPISLNDLANVIDVALFYALDVSPSLGLQYENGEDLAYFLAQEIFYATATGNWQPDPEEPYDTVLREEALQAWAENQQHPSQLPPLDISLARFLYEREAESAYGRGERWLNWNEQSQKHKRKYIRIARKFIQAYNNSGTPIKS
jgi:hypothetical protein